MAEASLVMGQFDSGFMMNGHVGGGLRLAYDSYTKRFDSLLDYLNRQLFYTGGLTASGGVSFIDNAAVPYFHLNAFASVFTAGLMFHFHPDGDSPDISFYAGLKFKFSADMQGAAEKRARKAQQL
jgi:hypothetical protein